MLLAHGPTICPLEIAAVLGAIAAFGGLRGLWAYIAGKVRNGR